MFAAKKTGAGILAAIMLTASMAPVAFAYEGAFDGTTDVTLVADAATTDAQLNNHTNITAPTEIPFALNADGSFLAPTADLQIINNSAIPAAVKSFVVTADSNTTLVAQSGLDAASGSNVWWGTVNGDEFANGLTAADQWNMTATDGADDGEDTIDLNVAGGMKSITQDFSTKATIGNISWTFTADLH